MALSKLTNITNLSVADCFPDKIVFKSLLHTQNLSYLNVKGCDLELTFDFSGGISVTTFSAIIEQSKITLTSLNLANTLNLTDRIVEIISSRCLKLKYLDLSRDNPRFSLLSIYSLISLALNSKELISLNLTNQEIMRIPVCKTSLFNTAILKLVTECIELRELKGCALDCEILQKVKEINRKLKVTTDGMLI